MLLDGRLWEARARINPGIPPKALEEAFRKVMRPGLPSIEGNNWAFHQMLVDGIGVEYRKVERIIVDKVWLVDFETPKITHRVQKHHPKRQYYPRRNKPCLSRSAVDQSLPIFLFSAIRRTSVGKW